MTELTLQPAPILYLPSPSSHIHHRPGPSLCFRATPATSTFQPYTLKVNTCNDTKAGTAGKLLLSFCEGYNFCLLGPTSEYNSEAQLSVMGAWNTLEVPLEYEPTTMSMAIMGNDAW